MNITPSLAYPPTTFAKSSEVTHTILSKAGSLQAIGAASGALTKLEERELPK